jgi:hypothetical protein
MVWRRFGRMAVGCCLVPCTRARMAVCCFGGPLGSRKRILLERVRGFMSAREKGHATRMFPITASRKGGRASLQCTGQDGIAATTHHGCRTQLPTTSLEEQT